MADLYACVYGRGGGGKAGQVGWGVSSEFIDLWSSPPLHLSPPLLPQDPLIKSATVFQTWLHKWDPKQAFDKKKDKLSHHLGKFE